MTMMTMMTMSDYDADILTLGCLPSDDDDPRHLAETVDAGYRAVVQPFDVAWQRTDGLDLRDDAPDLLLPLGSGIGDRRIAGVER